MLCLMSSKGEKTVVPYRAAADGENGLRLVDGRLEAWADGKLVASAPAEGPLAELMATYRVQEVLPEVGFAYGEPRTLDVELTVDFSLGSVAFGAITVNGERELWEAERTGSHLFVERGLVPEGARPWADAEPMPGRGWKITLPPFAQLDPDPVLRRRIALAIEAFLYALAERKEIQVPYKRRISTVFSAEDPMWAANVPVVEEGLPL